MKLQQAVTEALARGEVGVQIAVWGTHGLIAEAFDGIADRRSGRVVESTTVFPVYSVTKALTATALHMQVDRGLVSYETPIAEYWPEFAANGKAQTTVRDALTHRAGLPDMPPGAKREQVADWEWMTRALAAMEPKYAPGTTNAYHSVTWGWIVGEVVRRVDPLHRAFPQLIDEELLRPLGITDCWIGLPLAFEDRLAGMTGTFSLPGRAPHVVTEDEYGPWRTGGPSGGGVMTARAGARFFAMLANRGELDGVRLVSEERLLACLEPRTNAYDPDATVGHIRWVGAGGYWLGGVAPPAEPIIANGRRVLWHPGAGGAIGWSDLDRGIGVVICHNRLFDWEGVPRELHPFGAIADAVDAMTE